MRVRTDRGVYEADKLVITAGAWDGELLDVLEVLAVPERQVLAWLQPTRLEYFRPILRLQSSGGRGALLRLPRARCSGLQVW